MMVIYVPVKYEIDWTNHSETKMWTDRRMDKRTNRQTNERTELHQFRKEPSYDGIYVPVKYEANRTNCFRVPETKMWTDKRTKIK